MSLNFVKHENLRHRSEKPVSNSNHEISIIFLLRGGGGGGGGGVQAYNFRKIDFEILVEEKGHVPTF